MKHIYANDIEPRRMLKVWWTQFQCPYCNHTWERGGHKEGFVKSAANNHVAGCWELLLFDAGWTFGAWLQKGQTVVPLAKATPAHRRALMALHQRRKRSGNYPRSHKGALPTPL
jgi:hypothetical protein